MFKFVSKIIGNILLKRKRIDFTVEYSENNPALDEVKDKILFVVGGKGYVKWVYIKCPCGCGDVLTLSLMKKNKPNWNLKVDKFNRPTLYPSVWKKDGCKSHFWIRKGKLEWARAYY